VIILLDTSILIDLLRGRADRRKFVRELLLAGHSFAISAINMAEIYAGMRPDEEKQTQGFLTSFECLPVTPAIARRGGLMRNQSAQKGITLHLADTLIAATVVEHGLVLLTDNKKDFPMPEVTLL
jgi:predicted nucleic acid-binding protein